MPRHSALEFIPSSTGTGILPMDAIPDDVKKDFEDSWKAMKTADGRMRVIFDTENEMLLWTKQMASYAANRPAESNGKKLIFRRSPTKNTPKTVVDYTIKYAEAKDGNVIQNADGTATPTGTPKK